MNVLILGSGGREHAFAKKINESSHLNKLYTAPGNGGTVSESTNLSVNLSDFSAIKNLVITYAINIVIVGPEQPLVEGLHDYFLNDSEVSDIPIIGPKKQAAKLEASKSFAKDFMKRYLIQTATYQTFTKQTIKEGYAFLNSLSSPFVLKADGLAGGKGVLIIDDLQTAKSELKNMLFNAKFGKASDIVVIEEFLDGIELSCFVLTDGESYKLMPFAKDYKRIGKGNTGLNTGGMGAVSPVNFIDEVFIQKVKTQIIEPTITGLKKDAIDYTGFIFIGLIKVDNEPYVIEYNIRMGDPETQVVLPRLDNDLIPYLAAIKNKTLETLPDFNLKNTFYSTIILVSEGYPGDYKIGYPISGITSSQKKEIIHSGTKQKNGKILTNGGRVLSITAEGDTLKKSIEKGYQTLNKIQYKGKYYRKDIGFDL